MRLEDSFLILNIKEIHMPYILLATLSPCSKYITKYNILLIAAFQESQVLIIKINESSIFNCIGSNYTIFKNNCFSTDRKYVIAGSLDLKFQNGFQ